MEHVFICYSRKDRNLALQLKDALERAGQNVWIDIEDLPASSIWRAEIQTAITESIAFVYLASNNSLESEYCPKEFEFASKLNKRIFPILLSGITEKGVPEIISSRQWLTWDSLGENLSNLSKLIRDIETDYEWVKFITELGIRASRWEKDNSRTSQGKELRESEQKLASAGSLKDPQPTDLQRKFVSASRKAEQTRQKTTTGIIIGVSLVLCFLCVLSIAGGGIAYFQSNAKATAQIQADEQGNIALARRLATQAQSMSLEQGNTSTLSGLLAVEATKRFSHLEADQVMRNYLNVAAYPISNMKHDDKILSAAFNPISGNIATGSIDGTIRVWDVATGQEVKRITVGTYVYHVAFSPNGKWLIALYCDQMEESFSFVPPNCVNLVAHVFDTNTWVESSKITHGNWVSSVAFSPDSNWVVSGGNDARITVWEAATGKEIIHMGHGNPDIGSVSGVAFNPDGKSVLSIGPDNNAVIVWNINTGSEISRMNYAGDSGANFAVFNPSGNWIASPSSDGTIKIWETYSSKEVIHIVLDKSAAFSVLFSPDGNQLLSYGNDGFLRVWDCSTGQEISHMAVNSGSIPVLQFSPNGKMVISGGSITQIWDVTTGKEITRMVLNESTLAISNDGTKVAFANRDGTIHIGEFPTKHAAPSMIHDGSVESIAFSKDGKWIASGSMDGTTRVWDIESGKEISRMTVDGSVLTIDISPNSKWIAQGACEGEFYIACGNPVVRIWEALTSKEVLQLHPDFTVLVVKYTPDGKKIALAGDHGSIQLWDIENGNFISEYQPDLTGAEAFARSGVFIGVMDVSSNGQWIAAGSVVAAEVWDINSTQKIYRMNLDEGIGAMAFSPSGKWIASAGSNLRVWNPESGEELIVIPLKPNNSSVSSIAFSPDENFLVVGSGTTIQVWEISTGREVSQITTDFVNSVSFSIDGKWIASGGYYDNAAQIWLWRAEDLIAEVCNRLPRNLTHEEWKQFIGNEPYKATCPNLPIPVE